eukprot:m.72434 g.72434  ORF g.72434 m.72434 type:complete len:601 (+) comp14261_c0_seq1:99-1901(+)
MSLSEVDTLLSRAIDACQDGRKLEGYSLALQCASMAMALMNQFPAPATSPEVQRLKLRAKQALQLSGDIVEGFTPIEDSTNPQLASRLLDASRAVATTSPQAAKGVVQAPSAASASSQAPKGVDKAIASSNSKPPASLQSKDGDQSPGQPQPAHVHISPLQDATTTMTTSQFRDYVMQRTLQVNLIIQQRYQTRVASISDSKRRSQLAQTVLRQQHENTMKAHSEIAAFQQRLSLRKAQLQAVSHQASEPDSLDVELRNTILEFDAGPGMLIMTHMEKLKHDPTNVEACLDLVSTVFEQPNHPISQLVHTHQRKVYLAFEARLHQPTQVDQQDKDVLQQLHDGVEAISDVMFKAYPALRLKLPKLEPAAGSLGRLSIRRTSSDSEPKGSSAHDDEEEMEVRRETVQEHLSSTIEDALFTSEVWGMLRKSCSQQVLTSEQVFQAACQSYNHNPEQALDQVPVEFQDATQADAQAKLQAVEEQVFSTLATQLASMPINWGPNRKLQQLEALADLISQDASRYLTRVAGKPQGVGADILVELLSHLVKRSGRFALLYELKAIEAFLSPSALNGKLGYTFVTWSVVVNVIAEPQEVAQANPEPA